MTNYNEPIQVPREFQYLSPDLKTYITEYELATLANQLKFLNINSKMVYETMATALFPNQLDRAYTFVDSMYLVSENFGTPEKYRNGQIRHMYIGGFGIRKVMREAKAAQNTVYNVLNNWQDDIDRGAIVPQLHYFATDYQLMQNLDRVLRGLKTFDYSVRNVTNNYNRGFATDGRKFEGNS